MTLFVHYLADYSSSFRMTRWLMGTLDGASQQTTLELLPVVAVGTAVVLSRARMLDLLCLGDIEAMSRGLNVARTKTLLFVTVSIVVGQIVSIGGPVDFIGMMVPHIARRLFRPSHHILLPVCFFMGGAFLMLSDLFARSIIAPVEIPVGVITALMGGPFFLFVLLKRRPLDL